MSKRTASQSMGGRLVRNVTSLIFGEGEEERPRTSKRPAVRSKARKSGAHSASRTRRSAKKRQRRSTAR